MGGMTNVVQLVMLKLSKLVHSFTHSLIHSLS